MRKILILAIVLGGAFVASQAEAATPCRTGPPSWWNSPRVTYTYSNGNYASRQSHTFSAQRRSPSYTSSSRYRDPFRRW